MALIELTGISKRFAGSGQHRHVLDNVSLAIDEGEFVSIVGCTGAGKSTLLKVLAGLEAATTGEIRLRGEPLRTVLPDAGIVFQNYSLLPWFSALENVRLAVGAAQPGWPATRQREHAMKYLGLVGLANAVHRRPGQLSGGMRQRVAIARAFATEPAILLLDEPFGALDALTRGGLQEELIRLCSTIGRPVTVIMITNNVDEALLLSDRIVPMTRPPAARLAPSIRVEIPRPRTASAISRGDGDVADVRTRVIAALTSLPGSPAVSKADHEAHEVHEGFPLKERSSCPS